MESCEGLILVVEDHRATRRFLADNLCADGFDVIEADCLLGARRLARERYPDAAIVDLVLPDGDGLELIGWVRAGELDGVDPELPLLVLSGRGRELEVLRGFRRGCDDYIAKPFSYPELHARLSALLRRTRRRPRSRRLRVGPLVVDPLARQAWLHDQPLALSNKEFLLLRTLAAEPTRVFTRDELLQGIWGLAPGQVITRTLDSHAARLRRKLAAGGVQMVVNVWGVGYRLVDGELR
jgi:DNA-binding response OmpR family regulator